MKMMLHPAIAGSASFALCLLALPVAAQQAGRPWTLERSEVHTLTSDRGHTYEVAVALPYTYHTSSARYPVLIVLDGESLFPMATQVAAHLNYTGYARELIVVGISAKPNSDAHRARDFTPTVALEPQTTGQGPGEGALSGGGASVFLTFLRENVIRFIEATYRTEPRDRGVFGHSYAGLFALYTLFHAPDTFSRYIVSSPSLWWDQRVTLRFEDEYAQSHADLDARIFLGNGELEQSSEDPRRMKFEMVTSSAALEKQLLSRNYPSVHVSRHVFDGEAHMTVIPFAFSRGIRALYGRQQ